jgi:dTDP-L-rhamnose 4-epimerase
VVPLRVTAPVLVGEGRVLVTGGAGFIGSAVVRRTAAVGVEPVVYDRAFDSRDNVGDADRLRTALAGCDAVIHLAAKVGLGVSVADIDDYVRTNDLGTAVLLRVAAETGVGRVAYASSMVVYGEGSYRCAEHGLVRPPPRREEDLRRGRFEPACPGCGADLRPGLVPESAPFDPRNVYAATKVHGEHLLRSWCRETGVPAVALRFHNVYGPGLPRDTPYAGVAALFRSALARGQPPTVLEDGGQRRDFVHVDDVAAAVVAALTADVPTGVTALNVGSGRPVTIGEVATAMSRAMSGPAPVVTGGYRLGDVRHVTADCTRAQQVLGWRPQVSLADGVADLVTESG